MIDKRISETWELFQTHEEGNLIFPTDVRSFIEAHPDYQHGPVKFYNDEEIEEYVAQKRNTQ